MQQVMGLQKMSELATAEYVVTKIIKANDNKTWYKAGDRKILMTCKATLVAGIDLSGISEKDVNMEGQNISLTLPRAKLIYINIKPEDIRTAYEDISMFRSPFSSEEKNQLATQAENQLRAGANSLGIYTTAETNATIFINNFLRKAGFNNISIDFSSNKNILR
ncbi:MAG: DUF4230 domain-containing protein [Ginsengibacter sp.]